MYKRDPTLGVKIKLIGLVFPKKEFDGKHYRTEYAHSLVDVMAQQSNKLENLSEKKIDDSSPIYLSALNKDVGTWRYLV